MFIERRTVDICNRTLDRYRLCRIVLFCDCTKDNLFLCSFDDVFYVSINSHIPIAFDVGIAIRFDCKVYLTLDINILRTYNHLKVITDNLCGLITATIYLVECSSTVTFMNSFILWCIVIFSDVTRLTLKHMVIRIPCCIGILW